MDKAFSDSEIKRYIPNVVLYEELHSLTPAQLLAKLPLAILYQVTPTTGHWTLLHRTPEGIEFFDPYSSLPDAEFAKIQYKQPHVLAQLLLSLLHQTPIIHNQYPFQKLRHGTNTCGRWIILRHLFASMPLDVFAKMIAQACILLHLTPDELTVKAFSG